MGKAFFAGQLRVTATQCLAVVIPFEIVFCGKQAFILRESENNAWQA